MGTAHGGEPRPSQDYGYSTKADIYSFGITALELINGITPYHEWQSLKVWGGSVRARSGFGPLLNPKGVRRTLGGWMRATRPQILLNKLDSPFPPLDYCRRGLSRSFYRMVAACLDKDPAKRSARRRPGLPEARSHAH